MYKGHEGWHGSEKIGECVCETKIQLTQLHPSKENVVKKLTTRTYNTAAEATDNKDTSC